MNRDRLARHRAQQGEDSNDHHEMGPVRTAAGAGDLSDPRAFFDEVSAVRDGLATLTDNVSRISSLRSRALESVDGAAPPELDPLIASTRGLAASLHARTAALTRAAAGDANRSQLAAGVRARLQEALQGYQAAEREARARERGRAERQFKIVKPDATPEEVRAALDDGGGGQVFAQALLNSDSYARGRAAYRDVQERQADIRKIEETLTELHSLMQDMSMMVERQGEQVDAIAAAAVTVDDDVEKGHTNLGHAVDSARRARRLRWVCFFIVLAILIVVLIVLLLHFKPWQKN